MELAIALMSSSAGLDGILLSARITFFLKKGVCIMY